MIRNFPLTKKWKKQCYKKIDIINVTNCNKNKLLQDLPMICQERNEKENACQDVCTAYYSSHLKQQ